MQGTRCMRLQCQLLRSTGGDARDTAHAPAMSRIRSYCSYHKTIVGCCVFKYFPPPPRLCHDRPSTAALDFPSYRRWGGSGKVADLKDHAHGAAHLDDLRVGQA
eukprot:358972-Chlamydomonas_euryale.AAC.4